MKRKNEWTARAQEAATEATKQDELVEQRLQKWKRGTVSSGIALLVSMGLVVPFLAGHSLHKYWTAGRFLVYLSMCLLTAFTYAAATTYNFWFYLKAMKKIHLKVSPTPRKHRTGDITKPWIGKT
jgi:hypothetical protein